MIKIDIFSSNKWAFKMSVNYTLEKLFWKTGGFSLFMRFVTKTKYSITNLVCQHSFDR